MLEMQNEKFKMQKESKGAVRIARMLLSFAFRIFELQRSV